MTVRLPGRVGRVMLLVDLKRPGMAVRLPGSVGHVIFHVGLIFEIP